MMAYHTIYEGDINDLCQIHDPFEDEVASEVSTDDDSDSEDSPSILANSFEINPIKYISNDRRCMFQIFLWLSNWYID